MALGREATRNPRCCQNWGGFWFLTLIYFPCQRDALSWSRWLPSKGATRGASCTPASWTRTWWTLLTPSTRPSSVRQAQFHASRWSGEGSRCPARGLDAERGSDGHPRVGASPCPGSRGLGGRRAWRCGAPVPGVLLGGGREQRHRPGRISHPATCG